MKQKFITRMCLLIGATLLLLLTSCSYDAPQQVSDSGVIKATTHIETDPVTGMTVEQWNIAERLKRDNKPGSIKHLYMISSYSGECLLYSTVKGKVTSGGKRLSPTTVDGTTGWNSTSRLRGNLVKLNNQDFLTDEVLDDGGSYGESMNYLYWFDTKGQYWQIYPSSGMMVFISEIPLNVKTVTMNLELNNHPNTMPNDLTPIKKE